MADSVIDLFGASVNLQIDTGSGMRSFRSAAGVAADYIESISVKIGLVENIRIEIKLAPPIEDGIKLLKSGICGMGFSLKKNDPNKKAKNIGDGVVVNGNKFSLNKMAVQISYGGLYSPWFKAYILQPEFSMGSDGLEITMHGIGMLFDQTQTSVSHDEQLTPYEAVMTIFKDQNIHPVFEPKAKDVLQSGAKTSLTGGKNGQEQLAAILKANHCRFVYIGNKKGGPDGLQEVKILHVEESRDKNKVHNAFVAFKDINPNRRVFPILDMNAPLSNVMIGTFLNKVKGGTFNRSKKEHKQTDVDYKKRTSQVVSSDGSVPSASDGASRNQSGEPSNPDSNDSSIGSFASHFIGAVAREGTDLNERIHGAACDWMEKAFQFNFSTVCVPDLLPATMVAINVADIPTLSNNFDVFSVEHVISNGGCETHVETKAMAGMAAALGQGLNKVVGKAVDTTTNAVSSSSRTKKPTGNKLAVK